MDFVVKTRLFSLTSPRCAPRINADLRKPSVKAGSKINAGTVIPACAGLGCHFERVGNLVVVIAIICYRPETRKRVIAPWIPCINICCFLPNTIISHSGEHLSLRVLREKSGQTQLKLQLFLVSPIFLSSFNTR